MASRPIATRVTRGMAAVAVVSAVLLAATAAVIAALLLKAEAGAAVRREAQALAGHIARETREHAKEGGLAGDAALGAGVRDAFLESMSPGYRAEVWRRGELVASTVTTPPLGALDAGGGALRLGQWTAAAAPVGPGAVLVVAMPVHDGERALRIFAFSLGLAVPLCLAVALMVARRVAGRATEPLRDLQRRLADLTPTQPLAPSPFAHRAPAEVQDLEDAFRAQWTRLDAALRREREFVANASHELRMPLARLRLQAENARGAADSAPALEAQLREVDRLGRLVDSLLVLSRDEAGGVARGEAVNVADVARRAAAAVLGDAPTARCVVPDEAFVRGDEALIEIALRNLLDNARKFACGPGPVRAVLQESAGRLRVKVTTPGARIAGEDRDALFDRFYRSPEARGRADGHGLGLALARHIARLHGGDVCCLSSAEEDACFALDLPSWSGGVAPT